MELKIYHLKWEKYSWDKINSNLKGGWQRFLRKPMK